MKRTKPSAAKMKRPPKMTKEELIATLLKKKECNAKALSVVEGLLETKVSEQWLLSSLQFIGQSHYQDATEERAISKICGYPLCSNPLTNIPKQQYRISTQNNKVYDISERKNFCSNICYRSSSFLKDQILTSPLWLRDIETVPDFKLLDCGNTRGKVGDEVDVAPMRVTPEEAASHSVPSDNIANGGVVTDESREIENENKIVIEPSSDRNGEDIQRKDSFSSIINKPQITTVPETTDLGNCPQERAVHEEGSCPEISTSTCDDDQHDTATATVKLRNLKIEDTTTEVVAENSNELTENQKLADTQEVLTENVSKEEIQVKTTTGKPMKELPINDGKSKIKRQKRTRSPAKVPVVALESVSEFVEQRLIEWFTVDSVCYLYGEKRTKEMLGEQAAEFDQNFKPLDSATWDSEKHERFVKICKRLNLLDLEDKTFDEKVMTDERNVQKKPLPDFHKLKEEAEKMDLRVRAFYKGQLELQPRGVTFADDVKEGAEEETPVLPLVHQHEQRALRRRLVLDALNRVLPDLLRTLGINSSFVISPLRGLIGTFALTARNITLNPRQWTLVAIAVIKLLAVREASLNTALASEASQKYLTLIQMSFNLGPSFLEQLIDRLVSSALFPAR